MEFLQKLHDILQLNRLNAEVDMRIQMSSIESDNKEIAKMWSSATFHIVLCCHFGKHNQFSPKCVICTAAISES